MALGVLNNLSAIYAENNLNNTNSSLQTVLQQLSSGSKINSGADDAAGLSLVNGLEANQTALTQSETTATEGVGLLQVADGALSQVTSLLDRAITLATEASNGTLNSTQDAAANQEYQSILAEVNNIGSTTTYNQDQVFNGRNVAIYTGDSSTSGSSVDDLNIRELSSSTIGDTNGVMSYSSGQNNVFIDLSKGGVNAGLNDSLNAGGSTTIAVNYLTNGSNGSATMATENITVGTGTNYLNNAQGLITAINDSGLGLNASFVTATQAGTGAVSAAEAANTIGGGGADTGIEISGTGVGAGTNGAGEIGALTVNSSIDTLGGTLNVTGADGKTHNIALGTANSTDTIANLAATINADNYGVAASVDSTGKILTFTSADSAATVTATSLTDGVHAASATPVYTNATIAPGGAGGSIGSMTTAHATDLLTGTITVNGVGGTSKTFTLGVVGSTDTIANLAATINAFESTNATNFGVVATVAGGDAMTLTANAAGTTASSFTIGAGNNTPAAYLAAATPTNDSLTGTPLAAGSANSSALATMTGAITVATTATLNLGTSQIAVTNGETYTALAAKINGGDYGVTATLDPTGLIMTLKSANSAYTPVTLSGVTVAALTPVNATASEYYSVGISGTVTDTSTSGGTWNVGLDADTNGSGGVATMGYSDAAGVSLSGTDLLNQTDAESALTSLNVAIGDAAAQDGYIGAQINTLSAISQVMSTQQENVVSAQNAVQATDYASATSNMSKYEILSQTGIAALAQANSVQQEVTKLLQ